MGMAFNRRSLFSMAGGGIGSLALAQLGLKSAKAEEPLKSNNAINPLAPKKPHFKARAKSVILLFQNGGPSQMDLFDPKEMLRKKHGEPYPGKIEAHFDKQVRNLMGSPFAFQKYGESGIEMSELLPWTGKIADDLTLIRSMQTTSVDHEQALRLIHGGSAFAGKPCWGSWVVYALGSEREDLPAFVVLTDPAGLPIDGTKNWSSGFLPAVYQGTPLKSNGAPVLHLQTPASISELARANQHDLLRKLNASQLNRFQDNTELMARIENYELAAKMQKSIPEVLDLSDETEETRKLYGLDDGTTGDYGKRCLMARRLVEAGVRFVSIYLQSQPWDTHSNNAESLKGLCKRMDQPSAALVLDLKRRGLLDDTLVIWAGEFGRLPVSQGADGRDHNRRAFSLWVAGGGFKKGYVHGATDEIGYESVEKVVSVHELHATLMLTLGLDHERVTYLHEGRDDNLTDVVVTHAEPVWDLLS